MDIDTGYCEHCTIVQIAKGERYCEYCWVSIIEDLAVQYEEQIATERGLY